MKLKNIKKLERKFKWVRYHWEMKNVEITNDDKSNQEYADSFNKHIIDEIDFNLNHTYKYSIDKEYTDATFQPTYFDKAGYYEALEYNPDYPREEYIIPSNIHGWFDIKMNYPYNASSKVFKSNWYCIEKSIKRAVISYYSNQKDFEYYDINGDYADYLCKLLYDPEYPDEGEWDY